MSPQPSMHAHRHEEYLVRPFEARLLESTAILLAWLMTNQRSERLNIPRLGANGDVKMDVIAAKRELAEGDQTLFEACQMVYGLTDLRTGAHELPEPQLAHPPELSANWTSSFAPPLRQHVNLHLPEGYTPPEDVTPIKAPEGYRPHVPELVPINMQGLVSGPITSTLATPLLIDDEDMMAIINARGTVLLNQLYYGTAEQMKIVKLAELALRLFRAYAPKQRQTEDYERRVQDGTENPEVKLPSHNVPDECQHSTDQ
ncbi:hypothetical protein BDV95DRAFT_256598 [Massariosphaeria phaeospora]|uniref:Uncharacterized protein n=1 Tax=Massariosphaeria phaeospora TaxID=100035 RepID=A0A7C8MBF6_9PLEO|nr:hypothetical protein BDV95DRAFT_256598 [Massariosphaeria phaeospora]